MQFRFRKTSIKTQQVWLTNSSSSTGVTMIPCRTETWLRLRLPTELTLMFHYRRKTPVSQLFSLTRKLPNAELKMAAAWKRTETHTQTVSQHANTLLITCQRYTICQTLEDKDPLTGVCVTSFPPTALVRITAEETGGGMQLTVCSLGNRSNRMKRRTRKRRGWWERRRRRVITTTSESIFFSRHPFP